MAIPHCHETADLLRSADHLEGVDPMGGFAYDLDLTRPWVAAAIHGGHNVRKELLPFMSITEDVRYYEEDPETDVMIQKNPSAVWGLDSRTEYDLNREPDTAIPLTAEMFWGRSVYSTPPEPEMIRRSMEKYNAFYRFIGSVITVLLERFGTCMVYDFHAYNIGRQIDKGHASPPVFNIGTEQLDREKWGAPIDLWLSALKNISIPGNEMTVAENQVFFGRGNFCKTLSGWDNSVLVLPTEVSKVYMNEKTGELHTDIIDSLSDQLGRAITAHGNIFMKEFIF